MVQLARLKHNDPNPLRPNIYRIPPESSSIMKKKSSTDEKPSKGKLILTLLALSGFLTGLFGSHPSELASPVKETTNQTKPDELNIIANRSSHPEAKFNNKYNCPYGYAGRYCDPCGITSFGVNQKIVGGIEAVPHSWPSAVLIVFRFKADVFLNDRNEVYKLEERYLCGGSLINRDTIVTAAHCIVSKIDFNYRGRMYTVETKPNNYFPTYESMYSVYLGMHDSVSAFRDGDVSPGVKIPVLRVIRHAGFNEESLLDDIAVIKLQYEARLNEFIQLACLPNPLMRGYPLPNNQPIWAMGWGTTSAGGQVSFSLQNIRMTLYDSSMCSNVLPFSPKNWNNQLCAGEWSGGKDTCQGDSGGGIYVRDMVNNQMKFVVVGIVSYGDGCAKRFKPGLYTKISAYLDWIDDLA